MAPLFKKIALSLLRVGFLLSSLPLIFSLSSVSISETSNQALVCALVNSSTSQSVLACTGFPPGIIQIPLDRRSASFSGIVAGDGFLCALRTFSSSSTSAIVCWRFFVDSYKQMSYKRIYQGPALSQLVAGNTRFCGLLEGSNRLECWPRRRFNSIWDQNFSAVAVGENFVCGLSETGKITCLGSDTNIVGHAPGGNFSIVAAGLRHACAISCNGSLACWGDTVGATPEGEFAAVALGEKRSCGLRLLNGTVVCWGENTFSLPERLREAQFQMIETKRTIFCGVLTNNFSLACWGSEILESNSIIFRNVLPGPCRSTCDYGPLPGSGSFCGQGSVCRPFVPKETPGDSPSVVPLPPPSPAAQPPNGSTQSSPSSKLNQRLVAFIVVGSAGSLSLIISSFFVILKYFKAGPCRVHDSGRLDEAAAAPDPGSGPNRNPNTNPNPEAQPAPVLERRLSHLISQGNGAAHLEEFSLEVLLKATNNFSEQHKIGSGSFGSVYRATLDQDREVAIKRAETSSSSSYAFGTKRQDDKDKAFLNELELLSRLNHKNLVRLLGFCEESNERVLVYEHMSNGTLHDHLHKLQCSALMAWSARLKVALDAARGIEYLHVYAVPTIIHRDIKSSNILLDSTWTAKVSDFGLSLTGPAGEESHLSLLAAGTVGYVDPAYYRLQQLSTKSDVYSFGVVLLELLSGYKAIHKNEDGVPRNVVDFVVPYIVQDQIHRVLDPRVPPPTPFEIEAVAYVGYIAADCVTLEGRHRPTMTEILNSLEKALSACLAPPELSRSSTAASSM